jgi:hypothetical protein
LFERKPYLFFMTKLLEQALAAVRRLPPDSQDDIARAMLNLAGDAGQPTLGSVVTALENAKKGDYALLRAMFERNYDMTSSLISKAYYEFPEKYDVRKDIKPGGLLSMISKEILAKHYQGADARKRLAFWLAGVPNFQSPSRYLLYAAWTATYVGVTITAGLDEQRGLRAADAVVERLYARPRERDYISPTHSPYLRRSCRSKG